ncbi:MAG: 1-phosphofructokinase family hexose kinase [Acidimicrobiales bacterium]
MSRLVFVGAAPAVDRLLLVDHLEVGGVHLPTRVQVTPGGKALNGARVACNLTIDRPDVAVSVVGLIGGASGRWIADAVAGAGLTAHWAWASEETRTCIVVAEEGGGTTVGGRSTDFYESPLPVSPAEWEELCAVVTKACHGASWVALAGRLPPDCPIGAATHLIECARVGGARVAVDASSSALAWYLDLAPDLVKVNHIEAATVLDRAVPTDVPGLLALTGLLSERAGNDTAVAVTGGLLGACLAAPDRLWAQTTEHESNHGSGTTDDADRGPWWGKVPAVGAYPTGSGDAFLGAMLVALDRRPADWRGSLRTALGASAASAEQVGTAIVDGRRAAFLASLTQVLPAVAMDRH